MKRVDLDRDVLKKMYVDERKSMKKIGKHFGVSKRCIKRNLDSFGIPVRTMSETRYGRKVVVEDVLPYDLLYKEYIVNKKSTRKIGVEYGISNGSVSDKLRKYKIPARDVKGENNPRYGKTWKMSAETKKKIKESHERNFLIRRGVTEKQICEDYIEKKKTVVEICNDYGISDGAVRKILHRNGYSTRSVREAQRSNRFGAKSYYRNRDFLEKHYLDEKMSAVGIADMCGIGKTTISRWLKKFNIPTRSNSEAHIGIQMPDIHKEKRAAIMKDMYDRLDPPIKLSSFKWYKYIDKFGKQHCLQGKYELAVAKWLDEYQIEWQGHKGIRRFPYIIDGKERYYAPDFYLPRHNIFLEVKGFMGPKACRKMEAVKVAHPDLRLLIWFRNDLKKVGAL